MGYGKGRRDRCNPGNGWVVPSARMARAIRSTSSLRLACISWALRSVCWRMDHHIYRNLFSRFSNTRREDVQNQTIIFANYSTTLRSRVSIITTRQRTCLSALVGMVEECSKWTSKEVAHSLPGKDRPRTLPARYALTPVRGTRSGTCGRGEYHG